MSRAEQHSAMLPGNVTLWRHLPRDARAARSDVIKRDKRVSSQGTAKFTKGTAKTQINLIFNVGWSKISLSARLTRGTSKFLFCPLVITETGHFMETCRLFVDFILFKVWYFCDPAHFYLFIYLFIVIEINDYRYTRSSLTANETRASVCKTFACYFAVS